MNFADSLAELLKHEGGYVNHPSDPGGETNFGVTKGTAVSFGYTGDMKSISMSVVEAIYRKNYWDAIQADKLPDSLRHHVFDAAVNSGPVQAIKWLQEAIKTTADGVLGPASLKAIVEASPDVVVRRFCAIRLRFLTNLKTWPVFGAGWTRRICSYLEKT